MVKLIAIDLDDTLLNTKKDITNENKAAIKKALEKGIKIVIASGRPFFRVSQILKELVIDNEKNFVISYNGGYVSNGCNTVIIKKEFLNNNETIDIVNEINKYNLNFTIYIDDDIYTLGIKEQIIFPEINIDSITKILGMNITFVTSAKTDEEGYALLREFGLPFKNAKKD